MAFAPSKPERATDPYRVMLVDDSAVIRGLFARSLEGDPEIEVVASVSDGQMALNTLEKRTGEIEVVVLDIEMPRMDGLTALPKLIAIDPEIAVVMASTLTERNADISLRALALGAKEYIPKPTSTRELSGANEFKRELSAKVKALASTRRASRGERQPGKKAFSAERRTTASTQAAATPAAAPTMVRTPGVAPAAGTAAIALRPIGRDMPQMIAIGSSTGGPQALFKVLGDLPKTVQLPILLTQHMPPTFTTILAEHIRRTTGWECVEAEDGMPITAGRIHLARGDHHMRAEGTATKAVIRIDQGPPENFCRPAVDPMLRSIVEIWGGRALAVILTGMGHDGQKGCADLVQAGGTVVAQDEATSVVWGMPGAVARAGLCSAVLPLGEIAAWVQKQTMRRAA
ncbi:chemotaxis response regulator protein-glutamate methylesterase [Thalassobaculum sp.]|uniref:protein-glutamate methylesterase/protein-glutamine glutaminase n=1 Tax=Thalassobaculum sp. TaxID=2022740 RepID=UPI0032EB3A99